MERRVDVAVLKVDRGDFVFSRLHSSYLIERVLRDARNAHFLHKKRLDARVNVHLNLGQAISAAFLIACIFGYGCYLIRYEAAGASSTIRGHRHVLRLVRFDDWSMHLHRSLVQPKPDVNLLEQLLLNLVLCCLIPL